MALGNLLFVCSTGVTLNCGSGGLVNRLFALGASRPWPAEIREQRAEWSAILSFEKVYVFDVNNECCFWPAWPRVNERDKSAAFYSSTQIFYNIPPWRCETHENDEREWTLVGSLKISMSLDRYIYLEMQRQGRVINHTTWRSSGASEKWKQRH